ncbi:hypothetical protein Tco_0020286 [Tanacetum coccineum]
METQKPLLKDEDGEEVDVHMYRSMIGSLMYLTSSRPDIMFAVCACARYQVNPKVSHLHAVKRIFRYLKGQPKLGLWYLKDSPFDLVAYTNSDYARASLDRKSTTKGCQFLRCRLISWQCKKQTVVANFITKAEYVAASSCCGQVLWIQNQLLDYGYNFMHTKIFIDNNRKAKKSVKLMMEKLFRMALELMLVTQSTEYAFSAFSSLMDTRMSSELYPKDSPFDLVAYTDSDYAGASLDRKSTTGGCQFLGCRLISGNARNIQWLQIPQQKLNLLTKAFDFWSTIKAKTINREAQLHALVDGKTIIITESSVRRDLQLADEEVSKSKDYCMECV